jgi:hypothetical protein
MTINTAKLRVLADAIEHAPEQTFDMQSWFSPAGSEDSDVWEDTFVAGGINAHCGTAGCIAGWACNFFLPPGAEVHEDEVEQTAMRLLGVDTDEWFSEEGHILERLFTSSGYWGVADLADITREMAAQELRRLAEELDIAPA